MACSKGSASGDGKRKRGKSSRSGAGREFPGDPPTHTPGAMQDPTFRGLITESSYLEEILGVRVRITVEVKNWTGRGPDGKNREFFVDVTRPNDLVLRKGVAAIVHDLARLYRDGKCRVQNLNIGRVENWIRKAELPANRRRIGEDLLNEFVKKNELTEKPEAWPLLDDKKMKALKKQVVDRGVEFLQLLQEKIAEERSRAGRQREDEAQILPSLVEDNDPPKDLEKEVQRLKDRIASSEVTHAAELAALRERHNAEIASLKKAHDANIASLEEALDAHIASIKEKLEERNAAIGSQMQTCMPGTGDMDSDSWMLEQRSPQNKENQHLKATIIAMEQIIKAKDDAIVALQDLYAEKARRASIVIPLKRGFAEREGLLQNDSDAVTVWMDMCLNHTNTASHHPTD